MTFWAVRPCLSCPALLPASFTSPSLPLFSSRLSHISRSKCIHTRLCLRLRSDIQSTSLASSSRPIFTASHKHHRYRYRHTYTVHPYTALPSSFHLPPFCHFNLCLFTLFRFLCCCRFTFWKEPWKDSWVFFFPFYVVCKTETQCMHVLGWA